MKKLIFCLFFLTIQITYAQWEKTGWRSDSDISNFWVSENKIIIQTQYDGLLFSPDLGTNWKYINNGLPAGYSVYSLVILNDTFFASTGMGLYISTDMGDNWQAKNNGYPSNPFVKLTVMGDNIFAGFNGSGVYLSTDMGETWLEKNNGLSNLNVIAIAVIGDNIFVSTYEGGIFLSTDMGESWIEKNNGLPQFNYYFDEICMMGSNIVIASHGDTPSGYKNILYFSSDMGNNWLVRNNKIIINNYTYSMDAIPDAIVTATLDNVYFSLDTCNTWISKINDLPVQQVLNSLKSDSGNVFVAAGGELYLSKDKGDSWLLLRGGLNYSFVNSMTVIGSNIFIGASKGWTNDPIGGIFFSSDKGDNWISKGFDDMEAVSFASKNNIVVTGTLGRGCYLSTDNGINWLLTDTQDSLLKKSYLSSVAMMGTDIFVCNSAENGYNGKIYFSSDIGINWVEKNANFNGIHVTSLTVSDHIIYATTYNGIYLSSDKGETWQNKSVGFPDTDLKVKTIAISGNNIFAGTRNAVYLSTDLGESWHLKSNGLPKYAEIQTLFVVGKNIFAGIWGSGVYLTTDNGENWSSKNEGLTNLSVNNFIILDDYIYASTNSQKLGLKGDAIFKAKLSDLITDVTENDERKSNVIFPNPASDYIVINNIKASEILIYSTYGEIVFNIASIQNETQRIDISKLASGIYFLKIGDKLEKFVKI